MGGSCSIYGEDVTFTYKGWVGKPVRRSRRRGEDNAKMDFRSRVKCVDWIFLAQDKGQWSLSNKIM
jgi:hypothetical protein